MVNKIIYKKDTFINFYIFVHESDFLNFIEKNKNFKLYICDIENCLDNLFLDAFEWDDEQNKPFINIQKAKLIHLNFLKQNRNDYFKYLDIRFTRSLECEDIEERKKIIEFKQQLRDLNLNEFPSDPEKLKDFKPKVFLDIENLLSQN